MDLMVSMISLILCSENFLLIVGTLKSIFIYYYFTLFTMKQLMRTTKLYHHHWMSLVLSTYMSSILLLFIKKISTEQYRRSYKKHFKHESYTCCIFPSLLCIQVHEGYTEDPVKNLFGCTWTTIYARPSLAPDYCYRRHSILSSKETANNFTV